MLRMNYPIFDEKKVSRQCVTYVCSKGIESILYATNSDGYSNLV